MSTSAQIEIERLLSGEGVVARRQHPELRRALSWLVESGQLSPVLPGVYARAEERTDFRLRIAALVRYDPDAVLVGRAAAAWSFWPELRVGDVDAATSGKRQPQPGFCLVRRRVPVELVTQHQGVRLTTPALTALDLVDDLGGDGIDQALRVGAATLSQLHQALELSPSRRGNRERRHMLADSRDLPWARSERLLHRLLHGADLVRWRTNVPVRVDGQGYFLDVAFEEAGLALEVDGWKHHGQRPQDFDATLRRHSVLEAAGWRVLHFTWSHLVDEPDWVVRTVQAALECCARKDRPLIGPRAIDPDAA